MSSESNVQRLVVPAGKATPSPPIGPALAGPFPPPPPTPPPIPDLPPPTEVFTLGAVVPLIVDDLGLCVVDASFGKGGAFFRVALTVPDCRFLFLGGRG